MSKISIICRSHVDKLLSLICLIVLLLIWELAVDKSALNSFLLPPPSAIAIALADGLLRGDLVAHMGTTCLEALSGFAIGSSVAFIVGILSVYSPLFERTIYGYLVGIQTMPKIALAPLTVAWLGFGLESKILVAALISFFPVLVGVAVGLRSCDGGKVDVMQALAASEWQTLRLVRLPNALPQIFAGLNTAIVFALTGAIAGEFVGGREGLGYAMLTANAAMNMPLTFATLILLGFVGLVFYGAVEWLGRRVLFWQPIEAGSEQLARSARP